MESENKILISELKSDSVITINYISLAKMELLIQSIIEEIVFEDTNGMLRYNELDKIRNYDLAFVHMGTNIELSGSDYNDYDTLYMYGVFNTLKKSSPQYNDYKLILDKMLNDKLNENSIETIISKEIEVVNNGLGLISSSVIKMLDKGDPNKIAKYLSNGINIIANQLEGLDIKSKIEKIRSGEINE